MSTHKQSSHGDRCICQMLALAANCDPRQLSYNYCREVLQRRWAIECNHGCLYASTPATLPATWPEFGPADSVRAILIMNE